MLNDGMVNGWTHDDLAWAFLEGKWRAIVSWLTRKPNTLLAFDAIRQQLPLKGQHDAGFQVVPIDRIIGSTGRCGEFDRAFCPRRLVNFARWISISQAYRQGIRLPPVELYKVGSAYFVKDGHHRISVARASGQDFIDSYVTEIETAADWAPEVKPTT